MKELLEYRTNLLERLLETVRQFRLACLAVQDPFAPLEEGWSVHQIAVHTRDVDQLVYGLRASRTASEDNPEFANFDGNVYLAENYDPNESLDDVLNDFVAGIEVLVELLRILPAEAWSRLSRHTMLGNGLTLQSWVEKDLAHIEEHLATVEKAGMQKKNPRESDPHGD